MIKEIGLKIFTVIFCILLLCSCKRKKIDLQINNDLFFDKYSYKYDKESTRVDNLAIYYEKNYIFYDIEYYDDSTEYEYRLVYVFKNLESKIWVYENYYSISNVEKDKEYLPNTYEIYTDAVENGESMVFTNSEIQELINHYYA